MVVEPEPMLVTDPTLMEVLDELRAREPLFHRRELGTTRSHLEAMTTEDFGDVGASGRAYSLEYVLDTLEERYQRTDADGWETSDFYCRRIGLDVYLLTYTLRQGERVTRRSTLSGSTQPGSGRCCITKALSFQPPNRAHPADPRPAAQPRRHCRRSPYADGHRSQPIPLTRSNRFM